MDAGYGVEVSSGTYFGTGVRLGLGRTELSAMGCVGVLHPGRGATLSREVAEMGVEGAYRMRAWLDLTGGLRVRRYATVVARQRWTAPHLGLAARTPFTLRGVRGLLGVTLHPFASVSGLSRPEFALTSRVGMEYGRGRLGVQLVYSLERYDFARGTSDQRLEQVSMLTLQVQARARGRVP